MFRDQELEIEVIDIYFITRFSRKGQQMQLSRSRSGGGSTYMPIVRHYLNAKKGNSGKIDINTITNLPLGTILHTIARIYGA